MTKRFNAPNKRCVLHYLTINVREKKRLFLKEEYAHPALQLLREYCDSYPSRLIAYVLMPEHLHAIINPKDGMVDRFLSLYKPSVTKKIEDIAHRKGTRLF